jgi:hypothetical protein
LAGGGLRVGGDHSHHLGWDVELGAYHGSTATALGTVTGDLLTGRAVLLGHYLWPHIILRGGGGLRVGAARLGGAAIDPATVEARALWGPWGGPLVGLGLAAAAARLRIDLSVEAGYVLWPVGARVAGTRALAVEGPWFGLTLGLGALLSGNAPSPTQ